MDPEFAAAVAQRQLLNAGASAADLPSVDQSRAFFHEHLTKPTQALHEERLPPSSTYSVQDRAVAVEGGEIFVRCITPVVSDEQQTFPVLLFMHGGGFCAGSTELDDYHLRRISVDVGISVVNIDYRLAPENPFPTALNDCYAVLKWTVENAPSLKVDVTKGFIVGGHSAGANISVYLAHESKNDPFFSGRGLTGQLLREPIAIHPDAYPESLKGELRSFKENEENAPFRAADMRLVFHLYGAPPTDPRFSNLLYPSHAGIAPTYIQVLGLDPLRDDGIVYEKALKADGVKTKIDLYPGVGHGFHYDFPRIGVAEVVRQDLVKGLKWLLRGGHD